MCGIFGFLLSRSLTSSDLQLGKIGTEMLSHRGPDNSSYWADNEQGIFMGHRRLSIIDVSEKSNQPIQKNGIVLVYNGEIYNYLEIAKELKKSGIEFYSSGDAEVVLEAWKYWGESCLDRFDGMFAYALYQEGMLHLITDPFGEKPLYWAQTKDGIYFSSEPTPLVKLLDLNSNFSVDDVTAFLSLGFLPRERTGYSNLSKVNPGTHIAFSRDNYQKTNKYYAPPTPQWYEGPLVELTENDLDIITDSIINSLSIRLRSDVPLGIFLSSGVDSILLAALSVKELSNYPQALTVKFPENSVNDESSNAAKVAEYLGLPHEIIDSSDDVARTDPNLIFDLYGEANDNITVAANYQMSKIARSRIKVAVSGIGGDELFYGYNKYQFILKWRNFLNINEKTRNSISVLLGMMSFDRLDTIKKLMSTSDALRFIAAKNLDAIDWLSNLPRAQDVARELFSDDIDIALLGRHFDLIQTMPFTFIPGVERGSMRAGLEVRAPFINRKTIEILSGYDQRSLVAFGQKTVLRRILSRYLPKHLYDFPKRGFNYPKELFLQSLSQKVPNVPYIKESSIREVWDLRNKKGWQSIAVRCAILDHFANSG